MASSAKQPKIELVIDDGGHEAGYVAKGHHSREAMQDAIRWYGRDDFEIGQLPVEQTVMRCIPVRNHIFSFYYEYSKPGRGAFECTVVWLV